MSVQDKVHLWCRVSEQENVRGTKFMRVFEKMRVLCACKTVQCVMHLQEGACCMHLQENGRVVHEC